MYGDLTGVFDKNSGKMLCWFHGENKSLQPSKNTSFSALNRLRDHGGSISVTLFENIHARVAVDYDALPRCFEVVRFQNTP